MEKGGLYDGSGSEWDENEHSKNESGNVSEFREKHPMMTIPGKGNRFVKRGNDVVNLANEIIPRSVGAKYRNYDIKMPDGKMAHFAEGTHITNKQVFAGAGTKTPIHDVDRLVRQHGGNAEKWAKVKARATLEIDGETELSEIHWYEEPSVGKVEIKFKKYL